MTHEILSSHPRVLELDRALADLHAAERASKERTAALVEPYHAEMRQWEADSDAAILRGEHPPPRPPEPDLGRDHHAPHMFLRRRAELQTERREVIASIAGEVERDAMKRERELRKAAAKLVGRLVEFAGEWDQLRAAVANVREAADSASPERVLPSRASRMRSRVDVLGVVELVQGGGSVIDLRPVPGAPPPVGSDEPEPRLPEPASRRGVQL